MAPGKGFEPLRARGPLAGLPTFVLRGSRGQRDNHSATPAQLLTKAERAKNVFNAPPNPGMLVVTSHATALNKGGYSQREQLAPQPVMSICSLNKGAMFLDEH